jgi:hypothetical protein
VIPLVPSCSPLVSDSSSTTSHPPLSPSGSFSLYLDEIYILSSDPNTLEDIQTFF